MYYSLLKELRFKIGEQYELNEFNVKTIESTFNNGLEYENYEYIKGDFEALFGLKLIYNVILQYNTDILFGVIYKLAQQDLESLVQELNNYLPLSKKINTESLVVGKTFTLYSFYEFSLSIDIEQDITLRIFKSLG
ncbi:hypothetical protein HNV08_01045 [Winogradskyella eckloniae]|uniref:hypothetical protein n=1 Tax=Winogradskyella eckloniae TaxID=1089306 RepID=UPI00156581EF|nr:hypothetical protein [Winogradskyella eckloniae]NRD18616.1 hypothetical protein [Winogradskyella eckloniae]